MTREAAGTRGSAGTRAAATRSAATRLPIGSGTAGMDGAFIYHNYLDDDETVAVLDECVAFGFSSMIVTAVRYKTTDCSTNAYGWWSRMPGHLTLILDEAAKRGLKVYIGLVESSNVCAGFYDDPNKTQDVAEYTSVVTTLLASYGTEPALAGWYIIDEQALAYEQRSDHLTNAKSYFLAVRNAIRALSALPIMVAPYLGNVDGQGIQTPAQVGAKVKDFIDNTGGDLIVNMQDSVGADAISIGWSRTGDRAYSSRQYYEAMIAAGVPSSQLWADVELFNYPSGSFTGAQYRPASIQRLRHQLGNAAPCGKRFCWLPTTHMTDANDDAYPGANRMKTAYLALRGLGGKGLATPASYTWVTARESGHPDDGTKMFDGWPGDPRNSADPAWVGFATGGCQLTIDLGATKTVRWVGAHVLNVNASTYRIPTGITVEYGPDGASWTSAGATTNTYGGTDAEALISNTTEFTFSARYLRVTLANVSYKTLISEMEIVTDA